MSGPDLAAIYRSYIACLNAQDWKNLGAFVQKDAVHNGNRMGVAGYRAMLEQDFLSIPDLHLDIGLLVCDPPFVASRLQFDCTPRGNFLGLLVNGRKVSFTENVFYRFKDGKIAKVWSVIDKAAIETQLQPDLM